MVSDDQCLPVLFTEVDTRENLQKNTFAVFAVKSSTYAYTNFLRAQNKKLESGYFIKFIRIDENSQIYGLCESFRASIRVYTVEQLYSLMKPCRKSIIIDIMNCVCASVYTLIVTTFCQSRKQDPLGEIRYFHRKLSKYTNKLRSSIHYLLIYVSSPPPLDSSVNRVIFV